MRKLWIVGVLVPCITGASDPPSNYVAGTVVRLNDNGAADVLWLPGGNREGG